MPIMLVRSTALFAVIAVLGRDALEPRLSVLVEDFIADHAPAREWGW